MPRVANIEGIGQVYLYKRRGNRNIRLGFDSKGNIRISLPAWAPYEAGIKFAVSRTDWLNQHRPKVQQAYQSNTRIGKAHTLIFHTSNLISVPRVRVSQNQISVSVPSDLNIVSPAVQAAADRGSKKALKTEAMQLLPQKLNHLALTYGFSYKKVIIKQLKSKWGSCNQFREITLNYYLMQLPWPLIEYVLLHELVHTEHLNHSPEFWRRFEAIMPNAKKIRKELKAYKTTVVSAPGFSRD